MPCNSNFTLLYKSHFVHYIFFSLKIGTTTLVFQSSGIPFSTKTRWQSCSITSSTTLPPATIIFAVISESPTAFLYWPLNHCSVHLVVPSIFLIHDPFYLSLPYFTSVFLTKTNSTSTLYQFSFFNMFSIPFQ